MTTIVQSQAWPRTDDAIRALLDSGEPAVLRDGPVVGVDADSVAARLGRMLLQTNSDGIFPFVVERRDLQGGKKLQGVEVLHSLLADHAERLLVWALGGATVKAARLAKMIPVIVLHCVKGHHEDKVEEEPAKPPRKPRKSTFQQLPR